MAYTSPNPPNVNGVMTLTATQAQAIQTALQAIQTAFVATEQYQVCDTFYLTATYNRQNPNTPINGDTCQYCMNYGTTTP